MSPTAIVADPRRARECRTPSGIGGSCGTPAPADLHPDCTAARIFAGSLANVPGGTARCRAAEARRRATRALHHGDNRPCGGIPADRDSPIDVVSSNQSRPAFCGTWPERRSPDRPCRAGARFRDCNTARQRRDAARYNLQHRPTGRACRAGSGVGEAKFEREGRTSGRSARPDCRPAPAARRRGRGTPPADRGILADQRAAPTPVRRWWRFGR